ncbi:hypothetical protein ACRAR1_28480 [Streptomyces sanyensis]|uniref:hypothetical protein n=1 Tax=Streptomyces sanyensis TaxID=568869 RepID=UPI003D775788
MQVGLGDREAEVGEPGEQGVDAGVGDGAADVLAGALVRPAAEGQVGSVAVHGRGEVRADLRVDVARGQAQQHQVTGLDLLVAEAGGAGGPAAGADGQRRGVPHDLVEGVGQGHRAAGQARPEAAVGEDHPQGVGDQVGGVLVGRHHRVAQVLHDLVVREPGLVGDEPAGEVVARLLLLAPYQVGHDGDHELVALHGRLGALDHVADGGPEGEGVLLGHTELTGQDQHGQPFGELGDEVGAAVAGEGVDQLVGVAHHVAADAVPVEAGEAVAHGGPQARVLLAVGEDEQRLPRGDRQQGGVRLELHVPYARVAGELRGRPHHFEVLAVAEHEPGGYVAGQQDGCDRAVLAAQHLVQGVGGVRLRAEQAAGARARGAAGVGGAARRGDGARRTRCVGE